jgi:ATP-dependent helicase HrpA
MKDPAKYFGGADLVAKRLYDSIVSDLFCKNIRTEKGFFAHAESVSPVIRSEGKKKADRVFSVLKAYHLSRSELYDLEKANLGNRSIINFLNGLRDDLSGLVPENFMELYSTEQLIHLERYIEAITVRARRGLVNFEKDQSKADEIKIYINRLNELLKELSRGVSEEKRRAVEEYFWLLEEYKVSLFAQELKTSVPVSKKRLDKKINDINRMI